jgi:hypothetical protein
VKAAFSAAVALGEASPANVGQMRDVGSAEFERLGQEQRPAALKGQHGSAGIARHHQCIAGTCGDSSCFAEPGLLVLAEQLRLEQALAEDGRLLVGLDRLLP